MYIKIIGEDTHYNVDVESFTTQHGNQAIRFIGDEIPSTDKGFKMYDDEDREILDLSAYKHEYRSNEYTVIEEHIQSPSGNNEPLEPSAYDRMNQRLNDLNNKVNYLTPYEETKKAYYGENEKVFYNVPEGNLTVFFDNYDGEYEIERILDRLTITFPERLKDMTNITIKVEQ